MSVIDSHISLGTPFIGTSAAGDDELGSTAAAGNKARWRAICDELLGWWNDPSLAVVDDIDGPTRDIIDKALQFSSHGQENNESPPTRFAPCVDGGIAFEWEFGMHLVRVAFLNSMQIEIDRFEGADVVSSQHIAIT